MPGITLHALAVATATTVGGPKCGNVSDPDRQLTVAATSPRRAFSIAA